MKYDVDWFQGSSPLTRGKQVAVRGACGVGGLIPAHAGKTSSPQCTASGFAAHPRSRGENWTVVGHEAMRPGSSPLTRGKHPVTARGRDLRRLIPAHAGKTFRRRGSGPPPRAHPRSRGENNVAWHDPATPTGSSPLTRGKRNPRRNRRRTQGLIPAHAGKTRGQAA